MEAILRREIALNKTLVRFLSVSIFVILTALGAFVRIPLPFTPVPITLQTFFVLLGALFLGGRLSFITQSSYILLGILGLPIFTGAGCGLTYLFGPTGGYLFGFILASYFIGKFIKPGKDNLIFVFVILCLADTLLLFCGTIWLRFLLGYSYNKLLLIGFIPFIPGDLIKVFFASLLYVKFKARLRRIL